MTDTAPPPPDTESASRLPRHTTPTWEVELLISGVAVFAMLQLPGWLDDRIFALEPRFNELWGDPILMLYVYLKCTALILAVTFSMHLLLRARWIAMVGMHSIYPGGIRWGKLRMGAVQRSLEMRRHGSADAAIERVDNRATIVFAVGVMMASMFLTISLLVTCIFAVSLAIAALSGAAADAGDLLLACLAITLLPLLAASLLDRCRGDRLREHGLARRLLSALFDLYARIGLTQKSANPIFSLLASHGGERRAIALTTAVTSVVGIAVALSLTYQKAPSSLGNYDLFPRFADGSRTLDGAHYDDQRNPARDPPMPFIASMIASGPYLRLVVPYHPQHDAIALRDRCPSVASATGDARAAAALDCLQRLRSVSLDGKPLPALQFELGTDARTDRPALVAMIDVRALPAGRHELAVARAEPARGETREGASVKDPEASPWRIAFWR
ncbi:MAG TPA: hypothetical protein VIZ64_13465 [Dokdonella sp.]